MARAYSQDLRDRLILAVDGEGLSRRAAARRYAVSDATAVRWMQAHRQGRRSALAQGGDRRSRLPGHRDWLLAQFAAEPDLTLAAVGARLREVHGVAADPGMLSRFFAKCGYTVKKSLFASEQLRPDIAEARARWQAMQSQLATARLIFIDETGITTNMVRRYAWGPKGKRVRCYTPGGHWKITTFVAGLAPEGIVAPFVIDEPMNRKIFTAYVAKFLVPELRPGDVVIMDNLSSHKSPEVAALIEAAGAILLFLPAYSPDLNPIEMAFAKFKSELRKAAERTKDALWNRVGIICDTFPPQECMNYFRHAGYAAT
jgi:transposase